MNIKRRDSVGAWIGSTIDLARFLVRFDGFDSKPDLISKSTFDIMMTPSNANPKYAKGWGVYQFDGLSNVNLEMAIFRSDLENEISV